MMHSRLFIILLIFSFRSVYATVGLADRSATTPGGHKMDLTECECIYVGNTELYDMGSWYFYKQHIVGIIGGTLWNPEIKGYFVINEKTETIYEFSNENEWQFFIAQHHLKPPNITRWYNNDWTFYDEQIWWFIILGFYIAIPLFIIYIILLWQATVVEKLNFRRPYTRIFTLITLIWLQDFLREIFPQSF